MNMFVHSYFLLYLRLNVLPGTVTSQVLPLPLREDQEDERLRPTPQARGQVQVGSRHVHEGGTEAHKRFDSRRFVSYAKIPSKSTID